MKSKTFNLWKNILMDPMPTFEKLPKKEIFKEASWFFIKIKTVSLLGLYLYMFLLLPLNIFPLALQESFSGLIAGFGILLIIPFMIILFPFLLIFSIITLLVSTAIIHLFVYLLKGKGEFLETFQVLSYATAPTVFSFLPVVNTLASMYTIVLQIIGIHKVHKLSIGRSIAAILLPAAIILFIIMLISGIVIFSLIFSGVFA